MQKDLLIKSKINKNNLVMCVPVIESQKITNSFLSLHRYLKHNDFKGYEFDDILSSKVVKLLTLRNLFLERVAIQVGRRSIINLRRVLGVKKLYSSKAFGFFAKGYLYYYLATKNNTYLNLVREHLAWLENNYCKDFKGMSWGNAFNFASRGGFMPKGIPTIVWTSHISESFDFAYSVLKQESYKDTVIKSAFLFMRTWNVSKTKQEHAWVILQVHRVV